MLVWVAAITLTGFVSVALALRQPLSGIVVAAPAIFVALALGAHLLLALRGFRGDEILLPLGLGLAGIGLVVIYRVTYGTDLEVLLLQQLAWSAIALAAFFLPLVAPRDLSLIARYKYTWMAAGIALLLLTATVGSEIGGARIWFRIPVPGLGTLNFTSWELVKVVLVAFLAAYLDEYREVLVRWPGALWRLVPPLPFLAPILTMWIAAMFVLVFARDLGATLLFFGIFLAMLYLATGRVAYVALGTALLLAGGAAAYRLFAHVQLRVEMWRDPWQDPLDRGYQILNGLYALGNGGLLGAGLGAGDPRSIPVVWSDFVFAAYSEETGFLGALALLGLYLVLLYRGFAIAVAARTSFLQLLAAGLTFVIGLQALVIVAGNAKLIPLTGITLPFVAYGGSSLVTNFLSLGLLARIAHESEARRRVITGAGARDPGREGFAPAPEGHEQ